MRRANQHCPECEGCEGTVAIERAMMEAKRQVLICAAAMASMAIQRPEDGEAQQTALDPAHAAIDALARTVIEEAANLVEHPQTSYRRIELADKVRALLPADEVPK